MELAIALRTLWRHKLILLVGAVLSVLSAVAVTVALRSFQVGTATQEILVDTPSSQIVQAGGPGQTNLGQTANLLGTVMTQGTIKAAIAAAVAISPTNLATVALSGSGTASGAGTPTPPADSFVRSPARGIMTTQTLLDAAGNDLPIIWVQTRASTPARAVAMANAALASLRTYVDSTAEQENIPGRQRVAVQSLGPPQASVATSGPGPVMAAGAGIGVFALVCGLILLGSATARGWRLAEAREREELALLAVEDEAALLTAAFLAAGPVQSEPEDAFAWTDTVTAPAPVPVPVPTPATPDAPAAPAASTSVPVAPVVPTAPVAPARESHHVLDERAARTLRFLQGLARHSRV